MGEIAEPVDADELDWIVKRRGFNEVKLAFLLGGLQHLGLWNDTKNTE